jgi:membrane fusion protein (multidrug efflux system)
VAARALARLLVLAASLYGAWLWVGPEVQDALAGRARPKAAEAKASAKPPPLLVEVDTARRAPLPVVAHGTGTIRARQKLEVVSERARRITKLHVASGQAVAAGDPLITLDGADLRARVATLRAQLSLAQTAAARARTLAQGGAAPQAELDVAAARVEELKRAIAEVQVELDRAAITAPFAGVVGLIDLTEGALLQPGQRVTTLYDASALDVDVLLPERFASHVRPGLPVTAKVAGLEGVARGEVRVVEPGLARGSRSVLLRASLDGLGGNLDGAFAVVEVEVEANDALMIPAIAVIPGIEGRHVMRVVDGVAKSAPVEVGERTASHVQVLSGLQEGDVIAVTNLLRLRDGAPVTVKNPPPAPDEAPDGESDGKPAGEPDAAAPSAPQEGM